MCVPEMFSDHRMFMFLYALMEMAASVSNIICIAQITYEFVYYTLLVDQGRLVFCDSQVISNLFACEHRLQLLVNFCSQMAKLSANHVSRFLIFQRCIFVFIFAIDLTGTSLRQVKRNLFQFREMILCAIDHWASLPHKKICDTKISGYV